jgi:hypothetical protein
MDDLMGHSISYWAAVGGLRSDEAHSYQTGRPAIQWVIAVAAALP